MPGNHAVGHNAEVIDMHKALGALAGILFGCPIIAEASLVGDTISVERYGVAYGSPFSYTYGPIVVATGDSDKTALSGGNNLYIDPEAQEIKLIYGPVEFSGGYPAATEHLILISGIDAWISAISYATDLIGFLPEYLSFAAHSITLDTLRLDSDGTRYLNIQLQFGDSIPEPTTLALFGLGLAGLGGMWRKRPAA